MDTLAEDVRVTNDRLGQLEAVQIDTNNKITALEASVGTINTSLAAILQRLEERVRGCPVDGHVSSVACNNEQNYAADTEDGEEENPVPRRQRHYHRHGMGFRPPRREVRDNDNSLGRIKFTMPPFDGKYDPDAYLTWELAID